MSSYDGFFFVFLQYNRGYPGVLKNALDFLYREWQGKPATQFTGGSAARRSSIRSCWDVTWPHCLRASRPSIPMTTPTPAVDFSAVRQRSARRARRCTRSM
ncbi:NADPH-dependent FMN reductase [Gryllotalpicola kribbensis]|uniref:NADPH-dependent FMN reductase n=1 Tax=Gryllotalpicola kribbensis TaxID=993084 RepID=UPI003CD08DA4